MADEYKFGTSTNLGAMAAIKIDDHLKLDVLLVNGEGYKELQDASGKTRFGANLVLTCSRILGRDIKNTYNC